MKQPLWSAQAMNFGEPATSNLEHSTSNVPRSSTRGILDVGCRMLSVFHRSRGSRCHLVGRLLLLTLLWAVPLALCAQSDPTAESPNRFSASFRMAFNLGVKFKLPGGFPALTDPGPDNQSGMLNRRYDDGYNLVDNNNNTYFKE